MYVITSIFNPARFQSRYRLYRDFAKHVHDSGAQLITVEVAFGDRPFAVTEPNNPWHIQLRTRHELWIKENALNLGVARLPHNWQYMAWIDADIQFARPDWVRETVEQLQHNPVVQMFSHAHDLGPDFTPFREAHGFAYCYRNNLPRQHGYYGTYWHPGYAWAMRRETFDGLGGLIDFAIVGAADYHMAQAFIGDVDRSFPAKIDAGYKESCRIWQSRANEFVKGHLGFVPGSIYHMWHGNKKNRKYRERWAALIENKYDPEFDLKRDYQGLWQLTDRTPKLRRDIQAYFAQRNEDSIDLE